MNLAREHFFAHAGLAFDEERQVRSSHPPPGRLHVSPHPAFGEAMLRVRARDGSRRPARQRADRLSTHSESPGPGPRGQWAWPGNPWRRFKWPGPRWWWRPSRKARSPVGCVRSSASRRSRCHSIKLAIGVSVNSRLGVDPPKDSPCSRVRDFWVGQVDNLQADCQSAVRLALDPSQ